MGTAHSEPTPAKKTIPPSLLDGLTFSGFAQIDYLRLDRSFDELDDGTGEPLNENRFTIRRARLRMDKTWNHFGLTSITELLSGDKVQQVGLEALASLGSLDDNDASPLVFRAGLFPVPFGYESYNQPAPNRFFGERTLFVESFVPGRFDLGAALSGSLLGFDWIVAIQNGEPNGSPFAFDDPNDAKDISARVQFHSDLWKDTRLSIGTSFLRGEGFSPGTEPTKDSFEWRDLNEDGRVLPSELIPIPGASGRPSQNFDRFGVGADFQLTTQFPYLGDAFIYGEFAFGSNLDRGVAPADPTLLGRDQRGFGAYIAWVQEFSERFTLGLRFEHYDPNMDALELAGGITVVSEQKFNTLTSGLAYNTHLMGGARARVLAEYELQDNRLGRDDTGRPANIDNDTFRLRFEVRY